MIKILLASDHAGFKLKEKIKKYLANNSDFIIEDYGTFSDKISVDYPDYGSKVAKAIANGEADRGILVCKTGIGMSIIANRYKKVRAALCYDKDMAIMSRKHNNSNILVLAACKFEESDYVYELISLWLTTEFEGGRHQIRIKKLDLLPE